MKNKRFELLQMNLISVDTYAKLLIKICTYINLKHVHVSLTIQAKNQPSTMISTITQVLLFHKICVPFAGGPDIEPLSCQILIGVGCV